MKDCNIENPMETSGLNEGVIICLDELRKSPISNWDYHAITEYLAGAVAVIADDTARTVRQAEVDLKNGAYSLLGKNLEKIDVRIHQIVTIADIIQKRVSDNGFSTLCDLIQHYSEVEKGLTQAGENPSERPA